MSGVQGGEFWSGFASGALSSIASSVWSGDKSFSTVNDITTETFHKGLSGALGMNNSLGTIAFGTISGGAGASITGGNFWQGAVTGLVVSGLNHAMHDGDQEEPKQKPKVKKLTYQDDMNQLLEFNKFCLESYGYITGAVELSAVKWGVLSLGVKSLFSVGTKNLIPEGKLGNHLFKSVRDGLKLSDNPANRNLITKLSNGKSLGTDAFGKSWYAKNFYGPEGNVMQIFSYTQNGIIKGAGINSTPINLIKTYGLK